jgi:hypothetical protein
MLICFFDIRDFESVPVGATVNQTFYVEVLKRLIDGMPGWKTEFNGSGDPLR